MNQRLIETEEEETLDYFKRTIQRQRAVFLQRWQLYNSISCSNKRFFLPKIRTKKRKGLKMNGSNLIKLEGKSKWQHYTKTLFHYCKLMALHWHLQVFFGSKTVLNRHKASGYSPGNQILFTFSRVLRLVGSCNQSELES